MQAVIECSLRHVLALQVPRDGAAHAAGISYNNYAINLKNPLSKLHLIPYYGDTRWRNG
jgi:hypothetical protein